MRYLITGGSGYIGTRLVNQLSRREDTERIVICDVAPPKGGYLPKTEFEQVDVRDRVAVRERDGASPPRCGGASGVHPQPVPRRGVHVRGGRERHPQRAGRRGRDGGGSGAGHHLRRGLRGVRRQPGASHGGRSGTWRGGLLLRARQDGVGPDLPALGRAASRPADDHRAPLHRLRPQRGQLPGAALDEDAVHRGRGAARPADPVRPRGRRGGRRHRPPARPARRRLQRCGRRPHDHARMRRADRLARFASCRCGPTAAWPG